MVNREDMALVQRLFESAHNALQVELVAFGVVPEDMAIIIRDFQRLRRHMYFYLTVKKGYLQTFPWVFGGLSHRNLSIARGFARRILQMKQAISPGDRVHWMVLVLLFDARGLSELIRFSQGEDPSSLPYLLVFICIFRFALSTDRWVERLHARNKKSLGITGHSGPVFVAFRSMLFFLAACVEEGRVSFGEVGRKLHRHQDHFVVCTSRGLTFPSRSGSNC